MCLYDFPAPADPSPGAEWVLSSLSRMKIDTGDVGGLRGRDRVRRRERIRPRRQLSSRSREEDAEEEWRRERQRRSIALHNSPT